MQDKFNWSILARPSELIDLDSVVLMFLALAARMKKHSLPASLRVGEGAIFEAPLIVAEQLRDDQGLSAS